MFTSFKGCKKLGLNLHIGRFFVKIDITLSHLLFLSFFYPTSQNIDITNLEGCKKNILHCGILTFFVFLCSFSITNTTARNFFDFILKLLILLGLKSIKKYFATVNFSLFCNFCSLSLSLTRFQGIFYSTL